MFSIQRWPNARSQSREARTTSSIFYTSDFVSYDMLAPFQSLLFCFHKMVLMFCRVMSNATTIHCSLMGSHQSNYALPQTNHNYGLLSIQVHTCVAAIIKQGIFKELITRFSMLKSIAYNNKHNRRLWLCSYLFE